MRITALALLCCMMFVAACSKKSGGETEVPVESIAMNALLDSSYSLYDKSEYRQSIATVEQCLKIARQQNDSNMISECLSHEVVCYQLLGKLDSALILGSEQLSIDSVLGEPSYLASDYSNLAALYLASNRESEARTYIDRAIEVELTVPGTPKIGIRYGLASEIYNAMGLSQEALDYARLAYDFDANQGDTIRMGRRLCQMGDVQLSLEQLDAAEKSYTQAVSFLSRKGEKHSLAIAYRQLGTVYLRQQQHSKAITYLRQALTTSEQEIRSQMSTYEKLYEAYKPINPSEALHYYELFHELRDSIFTVENQQRLDEYHTRFQVAEKDQRIQQGESRLRTILIFILVASVVLGGTIFMLGSLLRLRIRRNKVLKKLEQMRANFFTNITHEFRTPLTIIQGLADKHIDADNSSDGKKQDFHTIKRQSHELLTLVNQILDYSRISSDIGVTEWRHGDVRPILLMITETQQIYAQQKEVIFECGISESPIVMDFTPEYLKKMLRNMLSNAIKYTPQGGHVYFTAKVDNRHLILRIADTGCGIDREDLKHIFQPFYRANASLATSSGSGIGLSLVHKVIQSMGGTIDVDSKLDVGTVFNIRLPLQQSSLTDILPYTPSPDEHEEVVSFAPSVTEEVIQPDSSDDTRPLLLIAEDNVDLAAHLRSLFADRYRVVNVFNGVDALEQARLQVPDLVLTDLMMPRMDGHEFCQHMLSSPLLAHVPVIILTAKDNPEDCLVGLQDGAVEYIVKPFDARMLSMRVDNIMHTIISQRSRYAESIEGGDADISLLGKEDMYFMNQLDLIIAEQMRSRQLSTEAVAAAMDLTRELLSRRVKSITGVTCPVYISQCRINYAKTLLTDQPELSVSEVAERCGYDELSHFSRAFKTATGQTPSTWHK